MVLGRLGKTKNVIKKGVTKMKKLSDFESNDDSEYYYQGYPGVTTSLINIYQMMDTKMMDTHCM